MKNVKFYETSSRLVMRDSKNLSCGLRMKQKWRGGGARRKQESRAMSIICLVDAFQRKCRSETVRDYQAIGLIQNAGRARFFLSGYKCNIRPDLGVFVFISQAETDSTQTDRDRRHFTAPLPAISAVLVLTHALNSQRHS